MRPVMSTVARIEHGVVIGKGHILKHHAIVIFVERSPAAVFALHGQNPVNGSLHRLALIASIRMLDPAQARQTMARVVHVRIKLIVEFKIPAARLALWDF